MKKILVASSLPYSQSNRGIDIITEALIDMNMNVTHLTFPSKETFLKDNKNFTQLGIKGRKIAYYERIMKNFPKNITQYFINQTIKPLKNFNFSDYDYIILESGKPIFLIDLIPDKVPIIYRQSDSVKYILSRNKLFQSYEDRIINKSQFIITVNSFFYEQLKMEFPTKIELIRNGINIPKNSVLSNPYKYEGKVKALYFGLFPLDYKDVLYSVTKFQNTDFHFIGPKIFSIFELNTLKKYPNFFYYGHQDNETINSFLKYSDFVFIPYKNSYKLRYFGLTSKYLISMYYNKPIISKKIGLINEFKDLNVLFYENKDELDKCLKKLNKDYQVFYNLDFNKFSKEAKIKEYKDFFERILLISSLHPSANRSSSSNN